MDPLAPYMVLQQKSWLRSHLRANFEQEDLTQPNLTLPCEGIPVFKSQILL